LATVRDYYELAADVLMRLDDEQPGSGFAAAALQVSERARARSLLDVLAYAQQGLRQSADPTLRQQVQDVQAALNVKAERLRRLLAGTYTQGDVDARNREIAGLALQYRELESRVRQSSARHGALLSVDAAPVADLQRALDADTAIVEYMLAEDRSFVWVLTRDGVQRAVLPPRRIIEELARTFAAAAATPETPALEASAGRLAAAVLAPIAESLNRPRLVIVPDGALSFVPFAALPVAGRPGDVGSTPLVADHDVVTAPSASMVALLRADARPPRARKTLAVFADPVYSRLDARVQVPVDSSPPKSAVAVPRERDQRPREDAVNASEAGELARLIGSRREAAALSELVPESSRHVALDFSASREAVADGRLADYRLLHFATHALIDNTHPELSGIALSLVDRRGQPQDGFLRLHEIYNLDLSADLVVLSACQTALGREIRGEGLIGLTRGFLHAGARRVVASLWKVDDRATAELMRRFYAAMLGPQRQPPQAALRTAQRAMLAQSRWRAPYYWAGFVLYGDWQ
jgi:CHAT domain-containing protein